ncbi:iron chelate uptake ABC transporter family permease subunit [Shinella sp. S4-D37]|uniref:iron chelate uptake ABC transporter family permease subunit n=1 Tax=Shinella sp. S4-D37 TaxID=3161999 RepID=UPI00346676F9
MTLGAKGSWSFVLPFRGVKLAGMLLVAYAIALSTVLFQTITNNRILTPSIMGFDALYALIQTVMMFFLGAQVTSTIDPRLLFVVECGAMMLFSCLLYRWLFSGAVRSLHVLMLVGIIFGILFRSVSGFLQRVIDPNEFIVLQDRLFASFNSFDTGLLALSALMIAGAGIAAWHLFPTFDILALGRESAITLGVAHRRLTTQILVLIAVLVSVSTALVGPVTFFGLLVASLAYQIMPLNLHRFTLPAAVLAAVISLVGGQLVLERMLAFDTAVGIVIEFVGGLVFLILLVRGKTR